MNSRIITKNHTADPEIGPLSKSISKPYGRATAIPTAWELIYVLMILIFLTKKITTSRFHDHSTPDS